MSVKKKLKQQKGASVVLALLLLLVVTLMCSSLFYILSSTLRNAGQGKDREQAMLLAQSFSDRVTLQIEQGYQEGTELGKYLSDNLGHGWSYYGDDWLHSTKKTQTRTFTGDLILDGENPPFKADVELSMYWTTSDALEEQKGNMAGTNRILNVTTSVTVNGQKSSVTTAYVYTQLDGSEEYWWKYDGIGEP